MEIIREKKKALKNINRLSAMTNRRQENRSNITLEKARKKYQHLTRLFFYTRTYTSLDSDLVREKNDRKSY